MKRLAWLLLAVATPAFAEPKKSVRDELPPAARTSWDNARELLDAQNWAAAKAEYEHAFELSQNPRVLFNVAVCEKNLGHYLKAAAAFRKEIASAQGKVPAGELQKAKDVLASLEPLITTVLVSSNEAGATLTVDREDQPGATPFAQPLSIDVGVHTLKLTKAGFRDAVLEGFSVVSGEVAQARFKLEPLERRAHVRIEVRGPGRATLLVDGRDVGNAPFDGELLEGSHVVEARADEFVAGRQSMTVRYREDASLVVTLAPKRHEGILRVVASPATASVLVDGTRVGTGQWEGPVSSVAGHTVTVKADGYYAFTQEIVLQDDQERTLPVSLNAEKNWIWWVLGSAAIVAGGVAVGVAFTQIHNDPIPGSLAAGAGWGTTGFRVRF